jgi:hypothetical protein
VRLQIYLTLAGGEHDRLVDESARRPDVDAQKKGGDRVGLQADAPVRGEAKDARRFVGPVDADAGQVASSRTGSRAAPVPCATSAASEATMKVRSGQPISLTTGCGNSGTSVMRRASPGRARPARRTDVNLSRVRGTSRGGNMDATLEVPIPQWLTTSAPKRTSI